MKTNTKIGLGIVAVLLVAFAVFGSNSRFFQGDLGKLPAPAPDEDVETDADWDRPLSSPRTGQIIFNASVNNAGGGSLQSVDVRFQIRRALTKVLVATDVASGQIVALRRGDYLVELIGENKTDYPGNYITSGWTGYCGAAGNFSIIPENNATCTKSFTHTRGQVTVNINVDNRGGVTLRDPPTFSIEIREIGPWGPAGRLINAVNGQPVSLPPGSYYIRGLTTITTPNYYTATTNWGGDCSRLDTDLGHNGWSTFTIAGGDSKTCTATVRMFVPDLVTRVEQPFFNGDGTTTTLLGYVQNIGGSSEGVYAGSSSRALFCLNDQLWCPTFRIGSSSRNTVNVPYLRTGEGVNVNLDAYLWELRFRSGTNTVTLCADTDRAVQELNETNNCSSTEFTFGGRR